MKTQIEKHTARKKHACASYFYKTCVGAGAIFKGDVYYSPVDDCIDPYHPYRICRDCMNLALRQNLTN